MEKKKVFLGIDKEEFYELNDFIENIRLYFNSKKYDKVYDKEQFELFSSIEGLAIRSLNTLKYSTGNCKNVKSDETFTNSELEDISNALCDKISDYENLKSEYPLLEYSYNIIINRLYNLSKKAANKIDKKYE